MKTNLYHIARIIYLAPIAIGLSLLFLMGPIIQNYLVNFVNGDAPTIYGSIYKEALIDFPSLESWIKNIAWYHILAGIITSISIHNTDTPKTMLKRGIASSFLVLMIIDLVYGTQRNIISTRFLFENTIINIFGAICICVIIALARSTQEFVFQSCKETQKIAKLVATISFLVVCVITLIASYYFFDYLYRPLPTQFNAHLTTPGRGEIVREIQPTKDSTKTFSFTPDTPHPGNASFFSGLGTLTVNTTRIKQPYKALVTLTSGCTTIDRNFALNPTQAGLEIPVSTDFSIHIDKGNSRFFTLNNAEETSIFNANIEQVANYWIDEDKNTKQLTITLFTGKNGTLDIKTDRHTALFGIIVPVVEQNSDSTRPTPRLVTISANNETYIITLAPNKNKNGDTKKEECKFTQFESRSQINSIHNISTTDTNEISGLIIKLDPLTTPQKYSPGLAQHIESGGGWVSFGEIDKNTLANKAIGKSQLFTADGNFGKVEIGTSTQNISNSGHFEAIGNLDIAFNKDSQLEISGLANKLWQNQRRINSTKWEMLGIELKVLLLGIIGSILVFLLKSIYSFLRQNKPFNFHI